MQFKYITSPWFMNIILFKFNFNSLLGGGNDYRRLSIKLLNDLFLFFFIFFHLWYFHYNLYLYAKMIYRETEPSEKYIILILDYSFCSNFSQKQILRIQVDKITSVSNFRSIEYPRCSVWSTFTDQKKKLIILKPI